MKVLKVQLGAEGVLVGHHPAGVFVGPVAHARTVGLEVRHLRFVLRPAVLGILLDVNDHAVVVPGQGRVLLSLPTLFLDVHEQPENNQIEKGPDDCQPHQDIHKAKRHVQWLLLQGSFRLKGHIIPKPDGSQCDKAVIEGLEKSPLLALGKCCRPNAKRPYAGEEPNGYHVLHGDVRASHTATLLHPLQEIFDKGVHAFTQALEHHQRQRDAQGGVAHAEGLPGIGPGGSVPISWRDKRQKEEVT